MDRLLAKYIFNEATPAEKERVERWMREAGGFDILGHMDLIKKNNQSPDQRKQWFSLEIER